MNRRVLRLRDDAKKAAKERDGWACQAPGRGMESECGGGLVVHHVLPLGRGGQDHPANLVSLCTWHHVEVHANPTAAYELGLLQRSGDAECAGCGHVSRLHSITYGTCTHGTYGMECPCTRFEEAA
jgi:hypothetical protein